MDSEQEQKSEVHGVTGDASTSPANESDTATTQGRSTRLPETPKLQPEPPSDMKIVQDDTDAGGPLVIKSTDPDLNPPQAPIDPFPTHGTPQIDPPVEKR